MAAASSSPAFHQSCQWPLGISTTSPGPATDSEPPRRKAIRPAVTVKRSSKL